MIAAGKLNQRLTIVSPPPPPEQDQTRNARGEATGALAPVAEAPEVWACIEPLTTRDQEISKTFATTVNCKITIRYRDDLSTSQRLQSGSKSWDINGWFDPTGKREDSIIYATEVLG